MLAFFDATAYQTRCGWQGKLNTTFMDGLPSVFIYLKVAGKRY